MNICGFVKDDKSQVLITVIILLALVFSLGASLIFHSRSFLDYSSLQSDTDGAYSLAKSGVDIAQYHLLEVAPCGCNEDEVYEIGDGTLRIQIETAFEGLGLLSGGMHAVKGNVTSTGTLGRSERVFKGTYNSSPVEGWMKVYTSGGSDSISAVRQASDGGHILGGYTDSGDDRDFLVIKTRVDGVVEWAKMYDRADIQYTTEQLTCLRSTEDGGYLLGGTTYNVANGETDFLIIKVDENGEVNWAKRINIFSSGVSTLDFLSSFVQDEDGNILLVGRTNAFDFTHGTGYDAILITVDENGNYEWAKRYYKALDAGYDSIDCVRVTPGSWPNPGYILGGTSSSFGFSNEDFIIIKIDRSDPGHEVIWARKLGGGSVDNFHKLEPIAIDNYSVTPEGYILGGESNSFSGTNEFLVIKLKAEDLSNALWAYTYGLSEMVAVDNSFATLKQTFDGGYVLGGFANVLGIERAILLKIHGDGSNDWVKSYWDGTADALFSLYHIPQEGYILGGRSILFGDWDAFLVKTNSEGFLDCCDVSQDEDVVATPRMIDIFDIATYIDVDDLQAQEPEADLQIVDFFVMSHDYMCDEQLICPEPTLE